MALIGSRVTENRWNPGVVVSEGLMEPFEEYIVDPFLPPLGNDPRFTSNLVVIPAGRLIGLYPDTISSTDRAKLTLADGSSVKPSGFARTTFFQKPPDSMQYAPLLSKQCVVEVPYVAAINGAYGTLSGGTPITAYFGSVASRTVKAPNDIGKIVKWIPKTVYHKNQSASTSCTLSSAVLPAFAPVILMAWNAGTVIASGASCIPAWNGSNWVATFGNNVTDVLYTYGQGPEMIAGEVIRVEPISTSHELSGWLKWVTVDMSDPMTAMAIKRVPTTAVTNEAPTAVSTNLYRLANYPVAPWKEITVTVTGTMVNPDGSTTTLTASKMSLASVPYVDYTRGQYYTIDALNGYLRFTSNVTVTSVTVSYSYETSYRGGVAWGQGIPGLTDGQYTGVPGTPGRLEVSGCIGALRCMIS